MKIWEIYEEIKEKAGVEKVNPENIQKIREVLSLSSLEEIAKKHGIINPRSLGQLDLLLLHFLKDPTPKQKAVLYYLFKKSNLPTSLSAIHRKLGFGSPYSCQRFISLKILEEMGLIRSKVVFRGNHKFSIIAIECQRFKEYWPDIENWSLLKIEQKERSVKERNKKGEQTRRAFRIISEELKGRGGKLSPEVVKIIKGLNRGDFHERGWEIRPRSLGNLKKRLLKMPIVKFIFYLKEAENRGLFYL